MKKPNLKENATQYCPDAPRKQPALHLTSGERRYQVTVPQPSEADDILEPEEYLPYRLFTLVRGITRTTGPAVNDRYGLSMREWRVLLLVGRYPAIISIDIANRLNCDKMIVSRAVGTLVRKELLVRSADPDDRRQGRLRLTRKGQQKYREIVPLARSYDKALRDALTITERREIESILDKLAARVREIDIK